MFIRSCRFLSVSALALFSLVAAQKVKAELITDPVGDFLPTYAGPRNGDLDVVSAQVFFDGSNFTFTSTQTAPIGTTPGALYVWGIDRGAGRQGFPVIAPGVRFDSVFVINPAGGSSVRDLINNTSTAVNNISFSGSTISGTVPLSDLPSQGLAPSQYTVNLWPRFGGVTQDSQVADFAPDNSNALVTSAVPEPSTISLFGMAACGAFALLRSRRKHNLQ